MTHYHLVESVKRVLQLATTLHRHQPDLTPLCEQVADTRVLKHRLRRLLTIQTSTSSHININIIIIIAVIITIIILVTVIVNQHSSVPTSTA